MEKAKDLVTKCEDREGRRVKGFELGQECYYRSQKGELERKRCQRSLMPFLKLPNFSCVAPNWTVLSLQSSSFNC